MASTRSQVAKIKSANSAALVLEEQNALAYKAMELRCSGMPWWKVAEKMDIPESRAVELVNVAISAASALVSQATRHEILVMELARLDALQYSAWEDAMDGDYRAGRFVLDVMEQRAKRLQLDAQVETQGARTVIISGSSEEYREAMRMIAEGTAG